MSVWCMLSSWVGLLLKRVIQDSDYNRTEARMNYKIRSLFVIVNCSFLNNLSYKILGTRISALANPQPPETQQDSRPSHDGTRVVHHGCCDGHRARNRVNDDED